MDVADRELIEWTAKARSGDVLPEPYRGGWGTQRVVMRLVELGVMPEPPAGALVAEIAPRAVEAAAAWLEAHPV
jgi:hypothetical protein